MKKSLVFVVLFLFVFCLFTLPGEATGDLVVPGGLGRGLWAPPVPPGVETELAESVYINHGSEQGGSTYADTQASDDTRHMILVSGGKKVGMYYNISAPSCAEGDISQIDSRVEVRREDGTEPASLTVYWYDWDGAAYVSMGSNTINATDGDLDDMQNANLGRFLENTTKTLQIKLLTNVGADGGAELWVDFVRVVYTVVNQAPVNDAGSGTAQICVNPDDGDNLYPRVRWYSFLVNVSDPDGYSDLDYVELGLWAGAVRTWVVRYNETSGVFSEEASVLEIELDAVGSSASKSGNDVDINFLLKIEWVHVEVSDYDLNITTYDESGGTGATWAARSTCPGPWFSLVGPWALTLLG
jgi:hypothetical protein